MAEENLNWFHAGISKIKDQRIRIPDRLFHEDILTPGEPAYWSYEKKFNILIVSNEKLSKDEYKHQNYNKVDENDYRCVIPKEFFEDYVGQGNPKVSEEVPEDARVQNGEIRHFIYNRRMKQGKTRSCYVLTQKEFDERFSDSDVWDGKLDDVPRFL